LLCTTSFLLLEIGKTTSLVVNIDDLALGLGVEVDELLASGCLEGLFVV
jgi:hypothetical protein